MEKNHDLDKDVGDTLQILDTNNTHSIKWRTELLLHTLHDLQFSMNEFDEIVQYVHFQ